jgi:hypothetical protein
MKDNLTSVVILLDQSGSMLSLRESVIKGFNNFLNEQRKVSGETVLTLCVFSTDNIIVYDWEKLSNILELDDSYSPLGGTALLDAMGTTIEKVGKRLYETSEKDRPSKIIFVVITDGKDNSSRLFNLDKIKNMVKHQQYKYNWNFIFFGANIDAISEGNSLGIYNNINYDPTPFGIQKLYDDMFKKINGHDIFKTSKYFY